MATWLYMGINTYLYIMGPVLHSGEASVWLHRSNSCVGLNPAIPFVSQNTRFNPNPDPNPSPNLNLKAAGEKAQVHAQ